VVIANIPPRRACWLRPHLIAFLSLTLVSLLPVVAPNGVAAQAGSTQVSKAQASKQISKRDRTAATESGIVKVLVYSNPPDFHSPWQKIGTSFASGSGVILDGKRILTAAHVVTDAVDIQVVRAGSGEPFEATVEQIGHDCDLALLRVADDRFFAGVQTLPLGDMPSVNDQVQTYGFPVGGETLSVTSGVVSRVEVGEYTHSRDRLLLAQIDAPINPGSSGGPVLAEGAIVGIASQTLEKAQSVGYMVPVPVIRHFLTDIEDGRYDGFPTLGVELQGLQNPAQREALSMNASQSGALVTRIDDGGPAAQQLKPLDVILAVEGLPVAGDLTVALPDLGRVAFEAAYESKQLGEKVRLSILRAGKPLDVDIQLTPHQALVPGRRAHDQPDYLVFAGLVFQPLTFEYLDALGDPPADLVNYATLQNIVRPDRKQILLISAVLPDAINRGYQDWEDSTVATVNGLVPRDIADLARILDEARGPWVEIVTEDHSILTLRIDDVRTAQPRILDNFGIACDRCGNLQAATAAAGKGGSCRQDIAAAASKAAPATDVTATGGTVAAPARSVSAPAKEVADKTASLEDKPPPVR